jgi:hypothetical protein
MLIVCGYPRLRPMIEEGTLFVLAAGVVYQMPVPPGVNMLTNLTLWGEPLPPTAELWFESAREHWH